MARNGPTPAIYGYGVRGLPGMLAPTHQESVPSSRVAAATSLCCPTHLSSASCAGSLIHLGQFHLGGEFATGTRIVTVAWIAIYVLVPALMVIVLAVQARAPGADPPRLAPLPAWLCVVLVVQA